MFRSVQPGRKTSFQCYNCQGFGHIRSECSKPRRQRFSGAKRSFARYIDVLIFLMCLDQSTAHQVLGYDCDSPTDHVLVPSPCLKQVNWNTESRYTGWVAYKAKDTIVQGIRCVTEVRLQSYYCGTSSHIHLLETPIVTKVTLTPEECNQVFKTKSIKLYNRLYSVEPNTGKNVHGIIVNGTLTYGFTLGVFNVFCNPTGINAANHFVDYGFQVGTLEVSVTQVPLLVTSENIIDYQKDTVIGHWSNCTRGCTGSTGSYYIPGDHTKYRLVKHLVFQKYTQGNQVFIVNHTENIHVEIYKITTVRIMNRHEQVLITELPDLVLFTNPDLKDKIPKLHAHEARYDIASWVNTLYKYKQLQNELEQQVQYEICVKTHRVRILPSTHYTRGKAITSLGELLRISTCSQVTVTVTEGRNDECYTNHITVQVGNITKAMLPGSRVLFKVMDMKPVSCKNHPVFLYIGNHSYLGNKGTGMELIQVKHEVNHLKTHIFWSPLDDAFKDLTVMGEQIVHASQVTYLNDLVGTESILQTTSDQVSTLESVFDWTLGKSFVDKFKAYFWSIVGLITIIAVVCCIICMLMKLGCKRIFFHKFIPAKNRSKKSDRSDKTNVELVEILDANETTTS